MRIRRQTRWAFIFLGMLFHYSRSFVFMLTEEDLTLKLSFTYKSASIAQILLALQQSPSAASGADHPVTIHFVQTWSPFISKAQERCGEALFCSACAKQVTGCMHLEASPCQLNVTPKVTELPLYPSLNLCVYMCFRERDRQT